MAKYTTGQYKLAEKYMYYVLGNNISSYKNVPDAKVPEAQAYLTDKYGVRLTTIEDLDVIHAYPNANEPVSQSVANYYKRPEKDDISSAAVERAVKIARNYTPYNNAKGSWTEAAFAAIPYVGLSPNVIYGQPPPKQAEYDAAIDKINKAETQPPTPENVTPKTGTEPEKKPDQPATVPQPSAQQPADPVPVATAAETPLWKKYWYVPVIIVGIGIAFYVMRKKK